MIKSNSILLPAIAMIFVNQLCQSQSVELDDPYLWLEEIESERSLDWVKEQNIATEKRISAEPLFDQVHTPSIKKKPSKINDRLCNQHQSSSPK